MNSSNIKTALWTTAVVMALAVAFFFAFSQRAASESAGKKRQVERDEAAKQRFEKWAYVAKGKELSPGEFVRLVVIPSASGVDILDTKCFIYTNSEYRTSQMICPEASQFNIDITDD